VNKIKDKLYMLARTLAGEYFLSYDSKTNAKFKKIAPNGLKFLHIDIIHLMHLL